MSKENKQNSRSDPKDYIYHQSLLKYIINIKL